MGPDKITCPSCGAQGSASDKFCGSCGNVVGQAPAASPRKATMLGMNSVAPPGSQPSTPAPAAAPRPGASRKHTMLGMSSAPPGGPASGTPQGDAEASKGKGKGDPALQKTMLGMQSPLGPAPAEQPPAPAESEPSSGGKGPGTVFGVQASDSAAPRQAQAPEGAGGGGVGRKGTMLGMTSPLAAGEDAAPASQRVSASNARGRTMLGMVGPLVGGQGPKDQAEDAPPEPEAGGGASGRGGAVGDPKTHRTMLGMVQPPPEAPADAPESSSEPAPGRFTPPGDAPSFSRPVDAEDDAAELPLRRASSRGKGSSAGLWLGVAALVCALGAAAALLWPRSPSVSAEVVAGKQGDTLRVRVPEAAAGTKVRFGGKEAELEAGEAKFPLAPDSLKVGNNHVSVDVVEPDGDVQTTALDLHVDYRARLDLAGLEGEEPAVAVVIDAVPGSQVSVAGKPVALDDAGRASVSYPVEDSAGARFDLEVPYRIEPPDSAAVEGTLELHLPVVSMQIDRPGDEVFTDADHIEIGGAVEEGASVRVGGESVPANGGRFLHTQPLGEAGEYRFSVVARAPGKAPSAREVRVTRVEDMATAAASFEFDESLSYARIAQNPAIYRGQHVAFDGRVYNVEVQGGRSILQMLVRDCPRGHKCQLWVDYAQATDASLGSMVRVLGELSGEQQYRSKKGGVQTAPAVTARFILPLVK